LLIVLIIIESTLVKDLHSIFRLDLFLQRVNAIKFAKQVVKSVEPLSTFIVWLSENGKKASPSAHLTPLDLFALNKRREPVNLPRQSTPFGAARQRADHRGWREGLHLHLNLKQIGIKGLRQALN